MKKKLRKMLSISMLTMLMMLSVKTTVFAGLEYLWQVSDATYVSTEHADGYFAYTYYGTASVRGTDRGYDNKTGYGVYYVWTKITYNVQGNYSSATAYSGGKNDSSQVVEKITVEDEWNNGPKTIAYYDYDTAYVNVTPGPIETRVKNDK